MMKRGKYSFSLFSLGLLAAEIGLMIWCLYQATVSHGGGGLELGCLGLFAVLAGVLGFRLAWVDRMVLGRLYRFPVVMMVLHGFVLILLAAMYMLGAVGLQAFGL